MKNRDNVSRRVFVLFLTANCIILKADLKVLSSSMRENGGGEGSSEKHCFLLRRGEENFPALQVPSQCSLIPIVGTEEKCWKVVFLAYFPYFEKKN
jgi:hypothetical protein